MRFGAALVNRLPIARNFLSISSFDRNQSAAGRLLVRLLLVGKETAMSLLKWALIFLVVSLIAALFGFGGIAAASADIARILFYIFIVIFLVLLILGLLGARAARGP
jgi:uncharacterized membrane protein YtjA (UPF0391 family)